MQHVGQCIAASLVLALKGCVQRPGTTGPDGQQRQVPKVADRVPQEPVRCNALLAIVLPVEGTWQQLADGCLQGLKRRFDRFTLIKQEYSVRLKEELP